MFRVPEGQEMQQRVESAEKNYVIQKNDYLQVDVYTSKGERLIDPDLELMKETTGQNLAMRPVPNYLVDTNGTTKLPMIGDIKLEGLSIREAEEMLQKAYSIYYKDAFVLLKYTNKRVVVLGATGGQVIPLMNENTRLVEILALAKGLTNDSKAQNIRVLRGEQVFVVDFSTIDGYRKNNLVVEPGDIVYVEPVRRPVIEGLRDYGPVLSIITSLTTLVIVIVGL